MNSTLQIQETIRDILAVDPILRVAGITVVMQDQADFARNLEEGGARRGGARGCGGTARGRDAKPSIAPMARRRDGDIAPYRNGTA